MSIPPVKTPVAERIGTEIKLEKFIPPPAECTKCSTGRKGRHNLGCMNAGAKPAPESREEAQNVPTVESTPLTHEKTVEEEPAKACLKCEAEERGEKRKGAHSKGCPMKGQVPPSKRVWVSEPAVSEVRKAEPLKGFAADWRSDCCDARLLPQSGEEGTNHYECFKCGNACSPVMTKKAFVCDDCSIEFEAEPTDARCEGCGSSNIWPKL